MGNEEGNHGRCKTKRRSTQSTAMHGQTASYFTRAVPYNNRRHCPVRQWRAAQHASRYRGNPPQPWGRSTHDQDPYYPSNGASNRSRNSNSNNGGPRTRITSHAGYRSSCLPPPTSSHHLAARVAGGKVNQANSSNILGVPRHARHAMPHSFPPIPASDPPDSPTKLAQSPARESNCHAQPDHLRLWTQPGAAGGTRPPM
jgi:hypothetical protein